uniref:Uncharacterized protein n=1 Tax=Glossina pallidipes TaxID=7398 RepID=A0A1A9Z5S6_GLOPL
MPQNMSILEEPGHLVIGLILSFDSALHPVLRLMIFLLLFWLRMKAYHLKTSLHFNGCTEVGKVEDEERIGEDTVEYLRRGQIRTLGRERTCCRELLSQPYVTGEYSTDPRRTYGTVMGL